jgi:hypothetical protein
MSYREVKVSEGLGYKHPAQISDKSSLSLMGNSVIPLV